MTRKPHAHRGPQSQEQSLAPTPTTSVEEASNPALDIEISHQPRFDYPVEHIPLLMEAALHTSPRTRPLRADILTDEGLMEMGSPFEFMYSLAVTRASEAIKADPDITPDQLFEHLWAIQRADNAESFQADLERGLCEPRILRHYAEFLGFQAALEVLAGLIIHPRQSTSA